MPRTRITLLALLAGYAVALCGLMLCLPFWLDEILQLIGTTQPDFKAFLDYHRTNPGGVPLGYLLQFWLIHTFGLSLLTARIPAALASLASCGALLGVARECGIRKPVALLAAFLMLPIQLRYAVEGRPYSHGLLFAILATWFLLRLARTESPRDALWYALAVAASLYSQGFAAFIQPGQILWLAFTRRWRATVFASAAFAVAGLTFLPWYLWTKPAWKQTITASEFRFESSPRVAVALMREISGDGYAASLPLWIGAAAGCLLLERRAAGLLAAGVLSGITLGFAADRAFSYFFAIRQFLFVAPGLLVLAVGATLETRRRMLAAALALLFAGGAIAKNYSYFAHPKEDWVAAAAMLRETSQHGTCLVFVPRDEPRLYTLFEPSLDEHRCDLQSAPREFALVTNLYTFEGDLQRTVARWNAAGYRAGEARRQGGTTVTLYRKPE